MKKPFTRYAESGIPGFDTYILNLELSSYYADTYLKSERNKAFLQVLLKSGKTVFISVHEIREIRRSRDGLAIIVTKRRRYSTDIEFVKMAMMAELAVKKNANPQPDVNPRSPAAYKPPFKTR